MNRAVKLFVILLFLVGFSYSGLFFPFSDYKEKSSEIERIEIVYRVSRWAGEVEKHYTIESRNGEYYSNAGRIDASLVHALTESFTDFYETDQYELGVCWMEMWPEFTVVITHTTGRVVLRSISNCHCFIPWNIEYIGKDVDINAEPFPYYFAEHDGETYVQYNGKIPSALFGLLVELDDYWSAHDKEARWGCYPAGVPEEYSLKGGSPFFPESGTLKRPEQERGASHLKWTQDIESEVVCTPLYADGRVFVASREKLTCFNGKTGKRIWEIDLELDSDNYAYCEEEYVTYEDGKIYFPVKGRFLCIDGKKGKVIWEISIATAGLPMYWNGKIFVMAKEPVQGLVCFDAETGRKVWEYKTLKSGRKVLIHEGKIYFGTEGLCVHCLDAESGDLLWEYQGDDGPARLYISGDYVITAAGTDTVCLDKETGKVQWEFSGLTYEGVFNNRVLVEGYTNDRGSYHILVDIDSGEPVWVGKIHGWVFTDPHGDETIYFLTDAWKTVVALDVESGKELWQYKCGMRANMYMFEQGILLALTDHEEIGWFDFSKELVLLDRNGNTLWEYRYGDTMYGRVSARMDYDTLLVFRGGYVEAFNAETGEYLWRTEVRGSEIADSRVINDRLYVCANDGMVYCLDVENGTILWVIDTGSGFARGERVTPYIFEVADGVIYVFTEDGKICAISAEI